MAVPDLIAQAGTAEPKVSAGLQNLDIPPGCKPYIIIAGEPVEVPGANCKTFKDYPELDFAATGGEDAVWPRKKPGTTEEVKTIDDAQDVIKGVLIHSDITSDIAGCFRVLRSRQLSTHFGIDWNGVIYQGTDAIKQAAHGGGKENTVPDANAHTIGIDMNCMLVQIRGNEPPPGSRGVRRIFEAAINGEPWRSVGYTDAQYDALVKLLRVLQDKFKKIVLLPPIGPDKQVIMEQTAIDLEKCGLFGHFHINHGKADPGPGFEWTRLIADLSRQANSFPLILVPKAKPDDKDRNIDSVYSEGEARKLAEIYYRNTEDRPDESAGGYFPIGQNGQWHGGVHLHARRGTPVLAMFPGRVVAAKASSPDARTPALGSNDFVLLRHEIAVDEKDPASRKFKFWSLYMHLSPFDLDTDTTVTMARVKNPNLSEDDAARIAPDWVHKLRLALAGKKAEEDAAEQKAEADMMLAQRKAEEKAAKKKAKGKDKGKDGGKAAKTAKAQGGERDDEGERKDEDAPLFLEAGKNLEALLDGRIALLEEKYPVDVQVQEVIGRVGEFGDPDNVQPLVHVEVFCDGGWREFVDLLGDHASWWYEANPDPSNDVMCDDGETLAAVLPEQTSRARRKLREFLDTGTRISGDQVIDFFRSTPADNANVGRLRQAITFHVSEWSDQVDWFKSLSKAQDWAGRAKDIEALIKDARGGWSNRLFAAQLRSQLPYIWLSKDVAMHAGLDSAKGEWDGHLYHFHPINFLMWLTFRFGTNRMKVRPTAARASAAQQKEWRKRQEAEERELREKGQTEFGEDTMPGAGGDLEPPGEQLRDLWEAPQRPTDWRHRSDGD